MVAPSLVMITSPSACLTILSMPLGPRDVLTASESALAASMFEILTSTFLESSLFRVWQRWQVWWKGVGAARSESSVKKKKRRRGGQTPGSDSQIPRRSRPDRRVSQRSPLRPVGRHLLSSARSTPLFRKLVVLTGRSRPFYPPLPSALPWFQLVRVCSSGRSAFVRDWGRPAAPTSQRARAVGKNTPGKKILCRNRVSRRQRGGGPGDTIF